MLDEKMYESYKDIIDEDSDNNSAHGNDHTINLKSVDNLYAGIIPLIKNEVHGLQ